MMTLWCCEVCGEILTLNEVVETGDRVLHLLDHAAMDLVPPMVCGYCSELERGQVRIV